MYNSNITSYILHVIYYMHNITCGFTGYYVLLLLFCVGKPLWIEVTSRKELVGTVLLLVLGVVCKLVCLITSAKALHENGYVMEKEGLKGDIWTMRILVQNG